MVPRIMEFSKSSVWDQFGDGAAVMDQLTRITRSGEGKRGCYNQKMGGKNARQAKQVYPVI